MEEGVVQHIIAHEQQKRQKMLLQALAKEAAVAQIDAVLGLKLLNTDRADLRARPKTAAIEETEIEAQLAARKEARADKDFAKSDAIRDELVARGIEVMDGDPLGWDWRIEI